MRILMGSALVVCLALGSVGCSTANVGGASEAPANAAIIVPDSPRLRAWDQPFGGGAGGGGQILLEIAGTRLSAMQDRYAVAPGDVDLNVIFRDHHTPVTGLMLQTKPVSFAFRAEAGRQYRIRGLAQYPPAADKLTRTTDLSKYAVVILAQDTETGQVIKQARVPTEQLELVEPRY